MTFHHADACPLTMRISTNRKQRVLVFVALIVGLIGILAVRDWLSRPYPSHHGAIGHFLFSSIDRSKTTSIHDDSGCDDDKKKKTSSRPYSWPQTNRRHPTATTDNAVVASTAAAAAASAIGGPPFRKRRWPRASRNEPDVFALVMIPSCSSKKCQPWHRSLPAFHMFRSAPHRRRSTAQHVGRPCRGRHNVVDARE
jgi:hypothetical protein